VAVVCLFVKGIILPSLARQGESPVQCSSAIQSMYFNKQPHRIFQCRKAVNRATVLQCCVRKQWLDWGHTRRFTIRLNFLSSEGFFFTNGWHISKSDHKTAYIEKSLWFRPFQICKTLPCRHCILLGKSRFSPRNSQNTAKIRSSAERFSSLNCSLDQNVKYVVQQNWYPKIDMNLIKHKGQHFFCEYHIVSFPKTVNLV
jgi:hypothetical protein